MKKYRRLITIITLCLALFATSIPYAAAAGTPYDGLTELTSQATAEATFTQIAGEPSSAENVLDGDLATRWTADAAEPSSPQAIQIDLGQSSEVRVIDAWWFDVGREYQYDLYVTESPAVTKGVFSTEALPVLSDLTAGGSGSADKKPAYRDAGTVILPQAARGRYVTLLIHEESALDGEASLWEMRVWGRAEQLSNLALAGTATATYEQITGGKCPASHAIDGKLNSRWSTYGAPQRMPHALQIDLGQTARVNSFHIWWYQTGRVYDYDLYVTETPTLTEGVFSTEETPVLTSQTGHGSGSNIEPAVESAFAVVQLPSSEIGRYITILVNDETTAAGVAAIWEVQVMGSVLSQDQKEIVGFREEPVIYADPGTAQDALPLPGNVTALMENGGRQQVAVQWSCENYTPDQPGSYVFTGQIAQEEVVANPQGLTVEKTVILEALPDAPRTELSVNDGWVFSKGTMSSAEEIGFSDMEFDAVNLPHSWNAEDGADGGNDYYQGEGWYRRHLFYREGFEGKRIYLYFEGVSRECTVYVNGFEAGGHRGAYTAFYVDITDFLAPGDNLIAVRASNAIASDLAPLSGDFTQYGGIYRDVSLVLTGETHLDTGNYGSNGFFMTTPEVSEASATVSAKADVVNDGDAAQSVTLQFDLSIPADGTISWIDDIPASWLPFDPDDMTVEGGQTVYRTEQTVTIEAGQTYSFADTFQVENPHLWNGLSDPFRYLGTLRVLCDGEETDAVSDYIGFRSFAVDADEGASLNGKPYNLRGVSRHQDREGMANALTVKEHNEDFSMIYDMGCNAVRLAHYPQADYFYELCDQYGVLVWAEIPFVNDIGGEGSYEAPDETRAAFFETTRVQLKELIRQQINHPSIVVWGIHNEVFPRHESVMLPFCEELANLCRSEDGTRLVTQATANASTPTWGGSELICTNLYPGFYYGKYTELTNYINTFRSQVGGRPVGISEYGCGANYEHHCEDYPAAVCSSGDYYEYEEYQSEAHESYLDQINRMDYLWCTFVWNMFDFGSDGRYEAQVGGINNKGLVSFDRTVKKDSFYLYKANWSSQPTVHLNSSRFTYRERDQIVVKGYSNCESVSLYVNGELVGALQQNDLDQETVFVWEDVSLSGGKNTVKLVGTLDGKEYTDQAEWYYIKVDSPVYTVRDNTRTLVLPPLQTRIETMADDITCNVDAKVTVYAEDRTTVLTEGEVVPGMLLCVEGGESEFWYTFVRDNLALSATAKATFEQDSCPAGNAIDGNNETRWSSYGSTSLPQGIQVDLGRSYALSSLEILWFGDGRTYQYDVYVTESPVLSQSSRPAPTLSQQTATGYGSANGLPDDAEYTLLSLPESTKGRYVTVIVTGGTGISTTAALWEMGIYRLELDGEEIDRTADAIDAIGEITNENYLSKLPDMEAAEGMVNALLERYGDDMENYIPNIGELRAARERCDRFQKIDLAIAAIGDIGGVTAENYASKLSDIEAAEDMVDALTKEYGEEIRSEISNQNDLTAARETYDRFAAIDHTIAAIEAIGEVAKDNYSGKLALIEAAENAMDQLTAAYGEEISASVTNLDDLKDARQKHDRYGAVAGVETAVAAIGPVTADNFADRLPAIQEAEAAVKALVDAYGESVKDEIANAADLVQARKDYERYYNDSLVTLGDVNDDKKIDATDALWVLQHSVDLRTLTDREKQAADVNKDGKINPADALRVLQYTVGLISEL